MKRKLLSALLAACMFVGMAIPTFAEPTTSPWNAGENYGSAEVQADGSYLLKGDATATNGMLQGPYYNSFPKVDISNGFEMSVTLEPKEIKDYERFHWTFSVNGNDGNYLTECVLQFNNNINKVELPTIGGVALDESLPDSDNGKYHITVAFFPDENQKLASTITVNDVIVKTFTGGNIAGGQDEFNYSQVKGPRNGWLCDCNVSGGVIATVPTVSPIIIDAVESVTITSPTNGYEVAQGGTYSCKADVQVVGGAGTAVNWSVRGGSTSTTINENTGVLTIGENETVGNVLTITATSTADHSKTGSVKVTVVAKGTPEPDAYPLEIKINPANSGTVEIFVDTVKEYTVSADTTYQILKTDAIKLVANANPNFKFKDWTGYDGKEFNMTASKTVTANFVADKKDQVTVTFDSMGGSDVAAQTFDKGGVAKKPTPPTKSGFTFDSWCTDANCTTVFDFSKPVSSSITLYAKWTKSTTPPPAVVKVTGVKLDRPTATLTIGDALVLQATVSPDNATDKTVTWKSSDEKVATVSNGAVTAVAKGNAVITVTTKDGGFTAECDVTVEPKTIDTSFGEPDTGNDTADKAISDLNQVIEENQATINSKIEAGTSLDPANTAEKAIIDTVTESAQAIVNTNISTDKIDPTVLENMDAMVQVLPDVETQYAVAVDEALPAESRIQSISPAGLGLNAIAESAKTSEKVTLILTVEAQAITDDIYDNDALLVLDMHLQKRIGSSAPVSTQPNKPILFTVSVPSALKPMISWINIFTDNNAYRNSVQPSWSGIEMTFPMAHFSKAIPSKSKYIPTNNTTYSGGGSTGFSGYWITAEAGPNGSISPAGETKVEFGDSLTVTVTPDAGYVVDKVLIDGTKEVTLTDGKYTFENVNEPYTIKATFKKASGTAETPAPETKPETPTAVNPPTGDSWFAHLFDGFFH